MKIKPYNKKAISQSRHSKNFSTISRFLGLLIIVLTLSFSTAFAATGFDPSFGNGGKVVISPDGSETTFGQDMALQSDGKIVMIGNSGNLSIVVARFDSNGSLDTSFGSSGVTSVTFGSTSTFAQSVYIQADGKILVGGSIYTTVNNVINGDYAVARLNPDGSLDTTFDGDGKATVSFNPEIITGAVENFVSLKVASDGKIVLAGYVGLFPQVGKFGITRLNADGSLDTTFGTSGRVIDSASEYKTLNDMTVLPDGSIVVVGTVGTAAGGFRIANKYNVNGSLEWSYGSGDGANIYPGLNGIAAQPDGKLIVVGTRMNTGIAIRLNADGTVDNSFNSPSITDSSQMFSVAVQPDGKIVANYQATGYGSFSVVRYNPNGTPDSSFGSGGFLRVKLTIGQDYGKRILVQPDGKILVGGSSALSSPERRYFSIARYQNTAAVNRRPLFDYDGDGKSDVSVYRPSNGGWYLNRSTSGFLGVQFGLSDDRIVPADYDGDGKTDIAIYRNGDWWILNSSNNSVRAIQFGLAEDKPQRGDFDGDNKDDLVVYRPSTGVWYVLRSSDNNFTATQWGLSTDMPQSADYDGDGRTDLAVYRPGNGTWYIQRSLGGNLFIKFGTEFDKPVASDYDGDGRADIAVWRFYSKEWFILKSSDNQASIRLFDTPGNIPVPADYDGDGKTDIAMFWSTNGRWYQQLSTQGSATQDFGLESDRPTPSAFNP